MNYNRYFKSSQNVSENNSWDIVENSVVSNNISRKEYMNMVFVNNFVCIFARYFNMKQIYISMKKTVFAFFSITILLYVFLNNAANAQITTETWTNSGTWTCPTGVVSVTVECIGGGGYGGRRTSNGVGGGGGGGAYAKGTFAVSSGSYTVNVGAGGTSSILAGGDSYFNNSTTIMAKGGSGVALNSSTGATGGQASASYGNIIKYNGGNGGTGSGSIAGGGGGGAGYTGAGSNGGVPAGGAGNSPGGNGGNGRSGSQGSGTAGSTYGGGGGGAYRTSVNQSAGNGAQGVVYITYYLPIYRSVATTGNWTSASSWEISLDAGNNWSAATTYPTSSNSYSTTIVSGSTITLDADITASNTTIESGATLNITSASYALTYASGKKLTNNGSINIKTGGSQRGSSAVWDGDGLIIDGWLYNSNGATITIDTTGVMRIGNSVAGAIVDNYGTITNAGGYQYWNGSGTNTDYYYGVDAYTSYSSTFNNYGTFSSSGTNSNSAGYYRGNTRVYHLYNYGSFTNGGSTEKRASSDIIGNFTNFENFTFTNNGNTEFATGGTSFTFDNKGIYNDNWMTSFNKAATLTNSATGTITLGADGCYRFNTTSTFTNNGTFINNNTGTNATGLLDGIVLNNSSATFNNNYLAYINGPINNGGVFNTQTTGELIYQKDNGATYINSNALRYYGNARLTYNSTVAQITSDKEFSTSTSYMPAYIEIDNINGVSLHAARTINSKTANLPTNGAPFVILANGGLKLNQKTLTMNSNSTSAFSRTNGFIVSEHNAATNLSIITWNIGSSTGSYTFPFGTMDASDNYIPVTFNKTTSTSANISISTRGTASNNLPLSTGVADLNSGGVDVSSTGVVDRWWEITPSASANADVTFTYRGAENTTDTPSDNIAVQHWAGAYWNDGKGGNDMSYIDSGLGGVTSGTSSVTATGITQFSPFVLVLKKNPLPIELIDMSANCDGNKVNVKWTTATETNNDYFTIERSIDAISWEFVKNVTGAGNNNSILNYSIVDKNPSNGTSYYRLTQTDYNGHSETFSPVSVLCNGDDKPVISYYPNPFTSEISVNLNKIEFENATINIHDMYGNLVYQSIINSDEVSDKSITITPDQLAAGIYMVTITAGEFSETDRIIKK
jgi:hypothetical protein